MVVLPGSSTGPLLAQAFAFQLDAVGIVDEPVQDGVAQGRVADDVMPAIHRHLAGDDQRPGVVAVFDDLQQVALLFSNQRLRTPIVQGSEHCTEPGRGRLRIRAKHGHKPIRAAVREGLPF